MDYEKINTLMNSIVDNYINMLNENSLSTQTDDTYTIYTITILFLFGLQSIINIFVTIDYIKSKQNTKLLIAAMLIVMIMFEIYVIMKQQ